MKIICIGRNYIDHAKELNNPVPEEPLFFMKPESALLLNNLPFYLPEFSKEIHYEVEVVVKINGPAKQITEESAHKFYNSVSLGIDFTARDIQKRCKEKGHPWEIAKAFDHSAQLGTFVTLDKTLDVNNLTFELYKNGTRVQEGHTSDMIFSIDRILSYLSTFVTLETGDLIYTGTPAGVGPVAPGDHFVGKLEQQVLFDFEVK